MSIGNQTGEGWFLTGEMMELIHGGVKNIVCTQPFACLPNHIVGKGVIKEIRHQYPDANIVAIDYDPGASEVNQLNRIKLMLSTANKNHVYTSKAQPLLSDFCKRGCARICRVHRTFPEKCSVPANHCLYFSIRYPFFSIYMVTAPQSFVAYTAAPCSQSRSKSSGLG